MATRDTAPIGAPCWVDLYTTDADRSRAFYSELFGWAAEEPEPEFGGYFNFQKDGSRIAGCMPSQPGMGVPNTWSVYLAVEDAGKTAEVAAASGGEVISPPMQVAELGTMAVIKDAGGSSVGIWQPGTFQGFSSVYEPRTPGWFELHTGDYDAAVEFYRDVFHWDTHTMGDTPEFRYTVLKHGEDQLAGIMADPGEPSGWVVYFAVESTDATLAKVVALGGAEGRAAEDTPYGRIGEASDPSGAKFKLMGPNKEAGAATV